MMLRRYVGCGLLLATVLGCGATSAGGEVPDDCEIRVDGVCYRTQVEACAAANCPVDRCTILRSYPGQVDCGPEDPAPEPQPTESQTTEPQTAETQPTMLGSWVGDPACVSDMQGMEGADQATLDSVASQISQNTFLFTHEAMEHRIGSAAGTPEPYTVTAHEGSSWTVEMAGPTGAAQVTQITVQGNRMRMERDGQLVICLMRP